MADSKYPTTAGIVTRGDAFSKLMYHLREAQDMAAVIGHLYNTEDDNMSKLLAKGWYGISELIKMMILRITEMAKRQFQ